uniref:Uncharacterized protein n=1 Tax=Gossypium raimondii TaxID=29730 RepID=A0A0D2V8I1_GOSRA|nr:hypothetical protein B456_013G030000 [Gossypium raimondii]
MALRSSDPIGLQSGVAKPSRNSRKKKKQKKRKEAIADSPVISEDPVAEQCGNDSSGTLVESTSENYGIRDNGNVNRISCVGSASVVVVEESVCQNVCGFGELRQRNVIGGGEEMAAVASRAEEDRAEMNGSKEPLPPAQPQPVVNGNVANKLDTAESLDWKRLMSEDPNYLYAVHKSPAKYFLDEMYSGNSLRRTTTLGSEKERERVYDTIFRLPWRCEVLIDVGFFVCFDAFLSLLTIMPTRILIKLWRFLTARQFKRLSAAELCDFGCFLVLACGVILLGQTDISLIYHMIRGQGTIKLYMIYNVLEIIDKLCQSFGGDVFETLFNSAEGLATCSQENMKFWIRRFVSDQALAMAFSRCQHFQTLNMQTEDSKKNLTFVPLAPACVVIRVLTPVYAAHLPYSPLPWRLFWIIFLISVTYVMLTSLKVMIGMGLQKHATWYVNRCRKRKHHLHFD